MKYVLYRKTGIAQKLVTAILLALSVCLAVFPCYALTASISQDDYDYRVNVNAATVGERYVLICVAGEEDSVAGIDWDDLVFIKQVKAEDTGFAFKGLFPKRLTRATIFIVGEEGEAVRPGFLRNPVSGDLDNDGICDGKDLDTILDFLSGCKAFNDNQIIVADTDASGTIDVSDIVR